MKKKPPVDSAIPVDLQDPGKRKFLTKAGAVVSSGLILSSVPFSASATRLRSIDNLDRLQNNIAGTVIEKGTPHYEPWRQSLIWQFRKFKRFPDVLVQAESVDDVVTAVKFARANKLKVTTRSGGHSWSGCYLRDNGVLIDLSRLQKVEIDTRKGIAKVDAGVIGRSLNEQLAKEGLVFPTAHCGMVPLSGFLLGGGLGWNSAAWGGMSVFCVKGIDVVTAEGEILHANENKNSEIFWAARGGGPGLFFTVTRFHLQCFPLPRDIKTDTFFFHYSEMADVVGVMEELGPDLNPNVEVLTVVIPTFPALSEQCNVGECGRVVALSATAFSDTEAEANTMLASLRGHPVCKGALMEIKGRSTPLEVLYQDNEGPFPQRRARADNIYTNRAQEATEVLGKYMVKAPSLGNTPVILWRGDLEFPDAAYSATGRFYLAGYAQWDLPEDDYANQKWLKDFYDEMEQFASGYYINEFDRETRSDKTSACFAAPNWQKLQQLRQKYDPDEVFHDFISVTPALG